MLDVTEQLDAGVRYLDLRIAHMLEGAQRNLHFVHMLYTTALVEVGRGSRGPAAADTRPLQAGGGGLSSEGTDPRPLQAGEADPGRRQLEFLTGVRL